MSDRTEYQIAKSIMGKNIIGANDLQSIQCMNLAIGESEGSIPISPNVLEKKKDDYLLILGVGNFLDGSPVTIRKLVDIFGRNPEISEPCFYNQDWYDRETFIDVPMKEGWFFIRKNVFLDSRAVQPEDLMKKYKFPSAVTCVYAFFTAWFVLDIKLWYHDFVWCSDIDHNGDRIYVGKYHDVDGVNKNGFSIHRHLGLRDCYGCVD